MGINERDYVRRDSRGFLRSLTDRGEVCKWLIGINIGVFVLQMLAHGNQSNDPITDALLLDADRVVYHGEIWRLLTHAFLHDPGDFFHILFNMLALWWFGADVEDLYGPREFLAFYLVSAVAGGVAFTIAHLIDYSGNLCLGASGAVTAVLVLCALHFPTRVIYIFMIVPVTIWLCVVIWVGYDAYTLLARQNNGVAVACHLGGAAFAFIYYKLNWRITPLLQSLWPSFRAARRRLVRPHLRVYREEAPEPIRAAAAPTMDEARITMEMDEVLEKMSRVGRENLTENDLDVLRRASEILRRRRT